MRFLYLFVIWMAFCLLFGFVMGDRFISPSKPKREVTTSNSFNAPPRDLVRQTVELVIDQRLSERMARDWYPELRQPGSALLEAVSAREQAMRDSGDTTLDDPDYPMNLAIEEADRLGIKPSKPTVITK